VAYVVGVSHRGRCRIAPPAYAQNRQRLSASSPRRGSAPLHRGGARRLFTEEGLGAATERSEGTTASFAKELVRRAVLRAALEDAEPADEHLIGALDDLLSDTESLTRSLLGVDSAEGHQGQLPPGRFSARGGPAPPR